MSLIDERTPIIVGVGQVRQKVEDPMEALEPLLLMEAAAELAAEDAGSKRILQELDAIRVPQGLWKYKNPGAWLAERFGATGTHTGLGFISGTMVLKMLSQSAAEIQEGRHDLVLVTGAEAEHSKRRAKKAGQAPHRTEVSGPEPDEPLPPPKDFRGSPDIKAGLVNPTQCFGLFEVALRHRRKESIEAHRDRISELWASFAQVAATNPHAWNQDGLDAAAIASPTGGNRVVSSPYNKYMVSNMVVDQGAALLLCSVGKARALGIPESRWVFPWVCTQADVGASLSERFSFDEEPTLRMVGRNTFDRSGLTPEDLGPIDLYSCFPSAVQLALAEMELPRDRAPTQTGGLTFAGGPFNSYVLHSLCRTAEALRKDRGKPALVSGVGGFMSRHAVLTLGGEARAEGFESHDLSEQTAALPARAYDATYEGEIEIESYVVPHGPEGPERAVIAGRTPEGSRCWAQTQEPELLGQMVAQEFCGRTGRVGKERSFQV